MAILGWLLFCLFLFKTLNFHKTSPSPDFFSANFGGQFHLAIVVAVVEVVIAFARLRLMRK